MRAVSSDFAPPLKLIVPFFRTGVVFYLSAALALLFLPSHFAYTQMEIAGWVHLFMLGFVMTIIFGAMAQLIPVVLETGHAAVDVYYVIFPMLAVGVVGMIGGFWISPWMLPYGGLLVLSAMLIFAVESFATLRKSTLDTLTVKTVKYANAFLLFGILSGFLTALVFGGQLGLDVERLLRAHVFAVIGGYVMLTVMGFSLILLPMFSLAHGFDETPIERAFALTVWGTAVTIASSLLPSWVAYVGYILLAAGTIFYLRQVAIIGKLTVRKEWDVWAKSMVFAFGSLAFAVVLWGISFIASNEAWLHAAVWFLLTGFVGFLIIGHLYKIIPFLVWFERFSPLVGKKKVPMLHEMYDKRGANLCLLSRHPVPS